MDQNNGINAMPEPADAGTAKTGGRFNSAFTQPIFLVICILLTVATVLSAFKFTIGSGSVNVGVSFNIIWLLLTIGAWIIYGKAKKGTSPLAGMKLVSGVVKVYYILKYVAYGFIFFFVWMLAIGMSIFNLTLSPYLDSLIGGIFSMWSGAASILMHFSLAIIVTVFIAGGIVLNAVFYRKVPKFTKSACLVEDGKAENVECANVARGWYIAAGIFAAVINGYNLAALVMKSVNVSRFSGIDSLTIISERISLLTALPAVVSGIIISVVFFLFSKWIKNNRDNLQ